MQRSKNYRQFSICPLLRPTNICWRQSINTLTRVLAGRRTSYRHALSASYCCNSFYPDHLITHQSHSMLHAPNTLAVEMHPFWLSVAGSGMTTLQRSEDIAPSLTFLSNRCPSFRFHTRSFGVSLYCFVYVACLLRAEL